jgi:hypothetical protein
MISTGVEVPDSLKRFANEALHLYGKWTSLGGDIKQFANEVINLKWLGPSKKKWVIVKDKNNSVIGA